MIDDGQKKQLPVQRRDRTPRTMLLFEREVSCPCEGRQHQMRETKCRPATEQLGDDEKRSSSISKTQYAMPTPPPTYRSRQSTLETLGEEDAIYVSHNE